MHEIAGEGTTLLRKPELKWKISRSLALVSEASPLRNKLEELPLSKGVQSYSHKRYSLQAHDEALKVIHEKQILTWLWGGEMQDTVGIKAMVVAFQ